jgi:hypothetical protein
MALSDQSNPATPPPATRPDPLGGAWGWFPWLMVLCAVVGGGVLMWRCGAFGDLKPGPRAAAAGVSAKGPSLADGYDFTSPRWPALFAALPGKSSSDACGPFAPETIENMSATYGFYLAQQSVVRNLSARFPALKAPLLAAEEQFERKFQRTYDNVDQLLGQHMPEWGHVRRQVEKLLAAPDPKATIADAQKLLDGIHNRTQGKFLSPHLETLLAFVPGYVADPQREILDGFRQDFSSEGHAKSRGVAVHVQYPRSWVAAESKQPLTVQTFADRRRAGTTASILIGSMTSETISEEDLPFLLGPDDVRRTCADAKLLDDGRVELNSKYPSVWREYRGTGTWRDATYRMRFVDFTTVSHGQRVTTVFAASAPRNASDEQLDACYARNAPLFKLIANSLDVN